MTAKIFDEIIEKFNPYHGRDGRFASAGAATSFTYAPGKSRAHDLAIERHKERMAGIAPTAAQEKTLKGIESRTRNLKKEQFRVVDRDGNVVMQKQGDKTSVSYSIGEARDNFPGNITIHNHPDGGTFSSADLSDIGHGATEIRAASPEGTYTLRNLNHGTKWVDGQKSWLDMRDDIDAASLEFKTARQLKAKVREPYEQEVKPIMERWSKRKAEGASQEELNSIAKEYTTKWDALQPQVEQAARKAYVDQYHSWYNSHAGEYGFEYTFTPTKTKTKKSVTVDEIEGIEKSTGEVVLDRKIAEDVEEIVAKLLKEYPRELQEDTKKSFNIYKTDNDKRLVFGWASIAITVDGEQLEDRQKDIIDPEDLEESAYEYVLNFRDTGEEHIPTMRKKGKLVESCVFTVEKQKAMGIPEGTLPVGWWVGFKIEDDAAWERVKNGTYRMFSIEGKANREPFEKAARNYDEFQSYDMWLEENLDATIEEQIAAKEHYKNNPKKDVEKTDRFEFIQEVRVAKTFDEILKFNPYHGKDGRFASANGAATFAPGKYRKYGQTNTADAANDIKSGKTNSLAGHLDENGNLTPEREAVHKQIIDDMLKGKMPVQGQATMTMLGGGPASGKSSVMNPDTSNDKNAVTVDPDAFKQMLPGYKEMATKDPNASSYYHEESSALAKRFAEVAFSENYNVIYDGTGDGSPKSVQKKIDGARANGYKVEAKYVSIDTEEAVRRNQKRYDDAVAEGKAPRLVPAEYVRSCHAKVTDISAKMADQFDSIEVWDNNGARGQQKLIATGGSGKGLKAVSGQEAAFKSYLAKGSKGEAGFTTLPDGTVIPVE